MKTLVTAEVIKDLHHRGRSTLEVVPKETIITPEARDVAKKLGVRIAETLLLAEDSVSTSCKDKSTKNNVLDIRRAIEKVLPAEKQDSALIEQLIKKAMQELEQETKSVPCEREVDDSGVILVRGNTVQFSPFDGVPDKPIGLADVIGSADNSPIATGFMQWKKASFPWTLTYDEIDIVLEGELHISCGGKTYIGKAGDVFYIPKNTTIEFSTPTTVRFVYVTYPADWAK